MKNIIPVTEARKNIFSLIDDIGKRGSRYLLTDKGRAKAVIMSADEFDSWQETLEVMREFPNLDKEIKEAEKQYKRGEYITLEELLAKEGYIVAEKGRKYETSRRRSQKNRKKA